MLHLFIYLFILKDFSIKNVVFLCILQKLEIDRNRYIKLKVLIYVCILLLRILASIKLNLQIFCLETKNLLGKNKKEILNNIY